MDYILETLGKVGFDWRMGLFHFINFMIVFWILKRYAFKPITKTINERQESIKEGVRNFEKASLELQKAEEKAQEIIDEAKGEANVIVEKSYTEAKAAGNLMKDKAKTEIEALITQAKKNIALDKAEMKDTLRRETVELVLMVSERLMGEKLDQKKNEAFIADILSTLK